MTTRSNHRQLKNLLIRKDVQFPIIAANLLFLIVVAIIIVVVLLSPLYYDLLHGQDLLTQSVSGKIFLILLQRISLAMLLVMIAAAAHQILLSHRFCGPLVNFNHTFRKMARGDFSRRVHLRKRDFLQPEAEAVNRVIDRLQADGNAIHETLVHMNDTLDRLAGDQPASEKDRRIEDLKQSIAKCRSIVSGWTFPAGDGPDHPAL